ncbi:flagellar basal-body rod modification protein FlgD [Chromohalobacter marismortui]|uniref:Basal-body rod modification protein FlgD n=1 Tax=Chromohalobacter marismortui TaxID=42055 RepID=A0A4R7NPI0_9GAMM|nr:MULTISPECIES: flagellar hook assembly protein FlgD [Chromohalobacter]MCI0508841.1 flagellar hook assembly protein FlgD [Chromohalobacter sp.]MCI0594302.1 flagellar hook assembly protein FlgD [Chromohalobacter sp.]TDU22785.1 flagellar basal-body rod modification protein FlgD [Chromohalobacter marismortui]
MASPVIGSNTLATINGTPNANATNETRTTGAESAQDLNDRFMTLLITQMQNQDPTKPMDNSQMTAQLAQINTVSGIQELNDSLGKINDQIDAGKTLQASSLIGQGVMVPGDTVRVGKAEDGSVVATPLGAELATGADELEITITNGSGQVVHQSVEENVPAGVQSFDWPGTGLDGNPVAAGAYNVEMTAKVGGEEVSVTPLNYALVQGVTSGENGPTLDLGTSGSATLDNVRQIL